MRYDRTFPIMTPVSQLGFSDIIVYSIILWLLSKLFRSWLANSRGLTTTRLRGPPSEGFLFGMSRLLRDSDDASLLTEQWASDYGPAFSVPGALGSSRVVLVDPKAVTHFYSRETIGYIQTPLSRVFIENLFGRGLLWAEGESHRRQRKALSPAFSNAAIRRLTSVFYDSSYKLKANWDSAIESNGDSAVIDVQKWMNHISLDSVGIAGFGHDFGSLDGKSPEITQVFEAMKTGTSTVSLLVFFLGPVLPLLLRLPTGDNKLWAKLRAAMSKIADDLLERTRKEKEGVLGEKGEEKSIIGLLVKAESSNSQLQMSQEEILAQMNVLLLAGYETTSISLTWALIELSRKPEKQEKLRQEVSSFSGVDPTWDQLASDLPYLDSVVHEVLRLHPPVTDTTRVAKEDDVIPLSTPVTTEDGATVSSITIKKGTIVSAPIRMINRSEAFWGPDAKEFRPERWLDDSDIPAKRLQGHRHILTFSDGPRICLGRHFALTEFKAALYVLIRHYGFEFLDGPETKIEKHRSLLPRPKVAGEDGPKVPLRVRRIE